MAQSSPQRTDNAHRPPVDFQLYLISDRRLIAPRALAQVCDEVLGALACEAPALGVALQLREKDLGGRDLYELASALRSICTRNSARLLINDRIDIALAVGADGVHLPGNAVAIADARRLLGPSQADRRVDAQRRGGRGCGRRRRRLRSIRAGVAATVEDRGRPCTRRRGTRRRVQGRRRDAAIRARRRYRRARRRAGRHLAGRTPPVAASAPQAQPSSAPSSAPMTLSPRRSRSRAPCGAHSRRTSSRSPN